MQGDGPVAFRTCLQSSPGHGDGVLMEAQVMGGIDREVQHGVGPGQEWVAGKSLSRGAAGAARGSHVPQAGGL